MAFLARTVVQRTRIQCRDELKSPFPFRFSRLEHMNSRNLNAEISNTQVSPSLVVIIVILTVIFFLSAFLHLLIRWLARNPRRNPHTRAALTALQDQLQQLFNIHDSGVEQEFIDTLPIFVYNTVVGLKEGADCAVCLCEFESDDRLRLLPNCSHAFHTHCIDAWLLSHSTCPLCRQPLQPEYRTLYTSGEGILLDSDRSSVVGYTERGGDLQREGPGEFSGHNMSSELRITTRSQVDERISSIVSRPSHSQRDDLVNSAHGRNIVVTEGRIDTEDLGRSSTHGSGRKVSIQLGKCKIIHESSGSALGDSASLRFYSKGSYEYVVDPSNLEVVITPMPHGHRAPTNTRLARPGHRATLSAEGVQINTPHVQASRSSCFSSASFSRLRSAKDKVAARDAELPTSHLKLIFDADSSSVSLRTDAKEEIAGESSDKDQSSLPDKQVLSSREIFMPGERSNRAVSFRLPATTNARIKAATRRRALSETDQLAATDWQTQQGKHDAYSLWETPCNDHQLAQPPCVYEDPAVMVSSRTSSVSCATLPSSNLANRTMDWLTQGWQKRLVHPDSAILPA